MNRWLETDTQKTARNIINVLNESAAGMVKKEINKDKPEEAPKEEKVALEKRVTKAAIKGRKPESKNAKMPEKTAKKIVKEELEPETEKSIEDQIADLQDYLNNTPEIAEDEKEAIQAEIDDLISQLGEDEMKDSNLNEDAGETATFEIDYADDDVDLSTEESVIEDVRNWLGTLANEVKIEVPELSGPAGGWPIVRLIGNKEKIAKFLLDNYNSGGEETLDDVYDLYLQENKLQEDNLNEAELFEKEKLNEKINHANDDINRAIANPNLGKNRDKIHAAGYEVTDYGLIKNPKTKKRIDPSQYSREEKKKVDFKGMLDSERKNNQGKFYPEYVSKGLKTGAGRGYAQADRDDMEAQNGISQNIKDYKDAVKTRDENRRAAERSRKNIPHYEKKVKDAQKDLEFQKNYTDELEKDADSMENKRKEILDKARAMAKKESMKEVSNSKIPSYDDYENALSSRFKHRYNISTSDDGMGDLDIWNGGSPAGHIYRTDDNKYEVNLKRRVKTQVVDTWQDAVKLLNDSVLNKKNINNTLEEDVEKMYDVISYYDDKLKGIEDSITSNDWSVITDFAHNKLMNGSYVKIVNTVSGKEKVITPSTYQDEFNGEFTIKPEGLTEAEDVQSELDDMKEQLQESDNEPKTVKEYRIMDGNKVLKTFSADERSKGYAEMRAMGKALRDAGKEDNLIYKEFTVKNKLKEAYSNKCLKEDSYDSGIFYEIEQAFEEAGLNPIRFIDDGILTRNIGWTVSSNGVSQQISCDGSWYDEDEDEDDEEYNESAKCIKEEYSEKFGGDPKDFIGDLISVKHQLSKLNLDGFGSHLARQMVEDFIDTCDRQIKKAKRLASGDEFYTEADNRTYKDRDEAEYYRNKELYANSNLARHREAMEKAKKACEEKGIKLDEDNYLSRTRKQEPLDLVAYEPEITSIDEVKDKYVKIRGDFHKVIDVKPEGDKFVISFAAGTGTAIGGEFEPATLDEIKRLQLYTENK